MKKYKIVDITGETIEDNLTEIELIEYANTCEWYELMDIAEEYPQINKIQTLEDAIKSLEFGGDQKVIEI